MKKSNQIGTLNEKPLHEALKLWYSQSNDLFEVSVDGFIVDILRGNVLIEIQTSGFSAIRSKLEKLLNNHHTVHLVYPIAQEKWIIKQGTGQINRRKSPKRGDFMNVFEELVSIPNLLINPDFSIELLLIQEEEVRHHEKNHGWHRKGWITDERRLLKVVGQKNLTTPSDIQAFIPSSLAEPFTTADLATAIAKPRRLAQKMVYCLRRMSYLYPTGKRARANLYCRS